ncbi:cytochrome P450 [Nocardia brevicatena]|uniref:cytochrome P450 n=1 Tax=Nocardia brevicatena TaxID=37327 RepID=UPI0002DDE81E|nr:cytochrome P450 [Nocardia brevicatena]
MTYFEAEYSRAGEVPPAEDYPAQRDGAVLLDGPGFHTDPHRLYTRMRGEHGPVVAVELLGGIPAWLVIGYRELHQVTTDPDLFTRDRTLWNQWSAIPPDWPLLPMVGPPGPGIYHCGNFEHRRHVAMVDSALESVDPFALRAVCEQLADRLIDGFCGRGQADVVSEFAEPLPILVLAWILGVPEGDGPRLARTMKALADGGGDALGAYQQFMDHMQQLLKEKQARPGDDLVSRMLAHREPFSDEEYRLDLQAITAAGHLPTADWIGNSVRLMLTDDRFAAALGGARHSIGQAMNEVLWEDTPNQILVGRWASRDTRLGEKTIYAGDMLLLGLAGANADPHIRQHTGDGAEPAHSGNAAHFAFGHGEFRCPYPAQQIAEIIARTGIEVLLDRLPDLDLAVSEYELQRRPSPFLRGTTSLPVVFTPVSAVGGRL